MSQAVAPSSLPTRLTSAEHIDLVDSHVHLNFNRFDGDLDEVAQRWRAAGVKQLVHSCCPPSEFPQLQAIADQYPEIFLSVGLHPLDVEVCDLDLQEQLLMMAQSDQRVVAIGETGLDFFKADNQEAQISAFKAHIRVAQQLDLPLIIHCREAAIAASDLLQDVGPVRGVMHCWGGNPEETQWFVDLGMYVSFSGIVTFKNAQQVRESAAIVPDDRLLIETDCPFLAPVPYRGKRNEPAFVAEVAHRLAEVRQIALPQLAQNTAANARELFRLPIPQRLSCDLETADTIPEE